MKKPCSECPFNKQNKLETITEKLGHASPFTYVGQILGPFSLPCHKDKNYKGKETVHNEVNQCVGAAMFRKQLKINYLPKQLPLIEPDELCFKSIEEFLATYLETSEEEIKSKYKLADYYHMLEKELKDVNVKRINLK